jgi:hypothetical protein
VASASLVQNEHTGAPMMAQHGSRHGKILTRAVFWVWVVFALVGLMTACVSDPCPGDQIMFDEACTAPSVATEAAQNRRNLRATQVADDERESDDATP